MPPVCTIDILQPTRRNPPWASGNLYASPPRFPLETPVTREQEVAETMVHRLPIINYDHLPRPQVAPHQEETMSDCIGWVLTHPDLEDQVCQRTAHINHFWVFSETYHDCATLERERITKVAHEAHLVCITAAQQVMNFLNNGQAITALNDLLPRQSQHADHLIEEAVKRDLRVSRPPVDWHERPSLTTITSQEGKENVQDGRTALQSPVFPSVLPLPPIAIPALATPTFVQGSSTRPTPLLSTLVTRAEEYALINKNIHEAIAQAASDPMDTDPLNYMATGVSFEDLASTEDKWNQFIHDQAAVAQGQPLDSPLVQSENSAGDPSIAKEATTTIDPFADPSLVISSQVFVIPKEESEQQHVALYVDDTLARRDNVPATWVGGDDLNRYHDEYLLGIPEHGEGGSSEWTQTQRNVALLQMVRNVISSASNLSPAAELGVLHEQVLSLPPNILAFHQLAEDIDCFPEGPESESGLLRAHYYKGWVVICSLNNCYYHLQTDGLDYLALTQSMNSTPFDRDEVLQQFHEVYMGDWQYTDDHRITNSCDHADHFFKDLDDMNGWDDLGGGEGANVTIPGLVV
ncbi:hypothetical protein V8D89_015862 [Ganoderma adspersum]